MEKVALSRSAGLAMTIETIEFPGKEGGKMDLIKEKVKSKIQTT